MGSKTREFSTHGVDVSGTVTEHKETVERQKNNRERVRKSSVIEYLDQNGLKHQLWTNGTLPIGASHFVTYLPERPEVAIVTEDKSSYTGAVIFSLTGLAMALAASMGSIYLCSRRKTIRDLKERVAPVPATVRYINTNTKTSYTRDGRPQTRHNYRYVAAAKIGGELLEFESFCISGIPQSDLGAEVELYVDPWDPHLYYLPPLIFSERDNAL